MDGDAGPRPGQQEGKNIRMDVTTLQRSVPQLKALADAGEKAMTGILRPPGTWILQDYGDAIKNHFSPRPKGTKDNIAFATLPAS